MAYPSELTAADPAPIVEQWSKPRLKMIHQVSVYLHEDGTVHAFHTRLDMAQYKVIPNRLADQDAPDTSNLSAALALIAAACEVYEDFGGTEAYGG